MQLAKHDVEVRLASSAHVYQQSVGPNVAAAVTDSDVQVLSRPHALTPSRPHALTPSRPHAHNHSTNLFKKVLTQGCMCPNQCNELQISTTLCVWGWKHRRSVWRRGGRVLLHTSRQYLVRQNKKQKKIKKLKRGEK